jgi:hypothetical protein
MTGDSRKRKMGEIRMENYLTMVIVIKFNYGVLK